MKRIIILYWLVTSFMFTACDNYLDIVPKGESVLNKTEDYLGLLEDMYGYPLEAEWYLCGEATSYNMSLIEEYSSPLISAAYFWDEDFDRAAHMTTEGEYDLYSNCYSKIANCNIIIDNMIDSEGLEEDKRIGIAQAEILRAYNYFYLINTYAKPYDPQTAKQERGIILRDHFDMEEVGIQSTIADAYQMIQQDIEDALPYLPHKALNVFRPDKSLGYGLKAKVHLFMREFDKALQASLDCIEEAEGEGNHQLWDMNIGYQNCQKWYRGMTGQTDSMFDSWYEYGGMMYSMIGMMGRNMGYYGKAYANTENLYYQHGYNFMSPHPTMVPKAVVDLFTPKSDLRWVFSMGTMPDRATADPGSKDVSNSQLYWNCGGMKLSEIYLMAAECYARKGDLVNAMKYLNDLRKTRTITKYYADFTASDKDEALTLVREERKRELLLTCNGFFDMRRFCTEFNETLTKEYDGVTYTLKPTSHLLTFPFPVVAIQNSNLVQNSK